MSKPIYKSSIRFPRGVEKVFKELCRNYGRDDTHRYTKTEHIILAVLNYAKTLKAEVTPGDDIRAKLEL